MPKGWGRNQVCMLSLLSGKILIRRHVLLCTTKGIRGSSPRALGPVSLFVPPGCIKKPHARLRIQVRQRDAAGLSPGLPELAASARLQECSPQLRAAYFCREMDGFEICKPVCGRGHISSPASVSPSSRGRARCPQDSEVACEVCWEPRYGASGVPADIWASKKKPKWPYCENQRAGADFEGWISSLRRPAVAQRIL